MNNKLWHNGSDYLPKICIHDMTITKIIPQTDAICIGLQGEMFFSNVPANQSHNASEVWVTIQGCTVQDLTCYYIRRYAPFHKAIRIATVVEFSKILHLLSKGKRLELVDEFYANGQLYWRLSVQPSRKYRLSDEIELRVNTFNAISYEWESDTFT